MARGEMWCQLLDQVRQALPRLVNGLRALSEALRRGVRRPKRGCGR